MILANYISDLLYRYDCVIVPDFGGFVTNTIGAKIDAKTHVFNPPKKQITFNSHLKHTDGLLANYIASTENISFEKASNAIYLSVIRWQNELQSNTVQLQNLGSISLNENGQILFEPNSTVNYLTESFGLTAVASSVIKRYKEPVKPLIPVTSSADKKGVIAFVKYAAATAILVTLGFASYQSYQQNKEKEVFANQQKVIQKKIQAATFVIQNPLPTIQLKVVREIPKLYHIIAGAFQFPVNAEKKVAQLKEKGFDAK
ncbi:MAG: HU domain-containing protein, partial [Polaribacter sp.]